MSNELFLVVVITDWYTSQGYFFLHRAGWAWEPGEGCWFLLFISNVSHVFPPELILPLAVIPAPYELGVCIGFPNKYLGLKFWEQTTQQIKDRAIISIVSNKEQITCF